MASSHAVCRTSSVIAAIFTSSARHSRSRRSCLRRCSARRSLVRRSRTRRSGRMLALIISCLPLERLRPASCMPRRATSGEGGRSKGSERWIIVRHGNSPTPDYIRAGLLVSLVHVCSHSLWPGEDVAHHLMGICLFCCGSLLFGLSPNNDEYRSKKPFSLANTPIWWGA